jgi:uncharacterized protein (TIGR00266 family)
MQFSIDNRPVFTTLTINFEHGESFKAEAGAMVSMSNTIEVKATGSGKGIFGSIKAAVGGEALFATVYTAERGPGELVLAPTLPGDVIRFDLQGTILAQAGAYLAGSPELELSTKGSFKAMFAGEGLFLSKISGNGILFLNSYGSVFEKELAPGEQYIVDTGHIVAFQEAVTYKLRKAAKGIFSTVASGEGLVCEYTGPGRIWVQTRNLTALGATLAKFVTKS